MSVDKNRLIICRMVLQDLSPRYNIPFIPDGIIDVLDSYLSGIKEFRSIFIVIESYDDNPPIKSSYLTSDDAINAIDNLVHGDFNEISRIIEECDRVGLFSYAEVKCHGNFDLSRYSKEHMSVYFYWK